MQSSNLRKWLTIMKKPNVGSHESRRIKAIILLMDYFQNSLFLGTLRGPVFIDSSGKRQPIKFIKKHEKCGKCQRPSKERA